MAELLADFVGTGLSEQKAKETLKNESVTQSLKAAIEQVRNYVRNHFRIAWYCLRIVALNDDARHPKFVNF